MAKFKVGDRVRYTGNWSVDGYFPFLRYTSRPDGEISGEIRPGMIGTVLEDNHDIPFVKWDNFAAGHNEGDNGSDFSNWAIIEEDMELL
jgi:hypothetical protein